MLMVLVAIGVVAAAVPLSGGSLSHLTSMRLRGTWAVATALAVQVAIISVIHVSSMAVARTLHLLTYVLIGGFLGLNRRIRWMWIVALGWLANTVAIAANGGVMPTSAAAAQALQRTAPTGFENSSPISSPRLGFLGDVLPTPADMPLANAFSVGDVALVIGLTFVVVAAAQPPVTRVQLTASDRGDLGDSV